MAARDLEAAVKAAQLYFGCNGHVAIRDEQKLYGRLRKRVAAVAEKRGVSEEDAYGQIAREARKRGAVCPLPGKDY